MTFEEGATSIIMYDTESRVLLRMPENTTCVILAKTDSYFPLKRLQYTEYITDANKYTKPDDFLPQKLFVNKIVLM